MPEESVRFAASAHAGRAVNPLRRIVEGLVPPAGHPLPMLSLTLGDPAVYGAFPPPEALQRAVTAAASAAGGSRAAVDGYAHSAGGKEARAAAAAWMSCARPDGAPQTLTARDVVLASGCAGALELALSVVRARGRRHAPQCAA